MRIAPFYHAVLTLAPGEPLPGLRVPEWVQRAGYDPVAYRAPRLGETIFVRGSRKLRLALPRDTRREHLVVVYRRGRH
jgi:hypothetical protein